MRCDVEIIGVAASSVLALLGVWLGSVLASRAQERMWQRERRQRLDEVRRQAFVTFMAAARRYRSFVMDPSACIENVPHPTDGSPLPLLGEGARPYKDDYESAWSNVLLLAS